MKDKRKEILGWALDLEDCQKLENSEEKMFIDKNDVNYWINEIESEIKEAKEMLSSIDSIRTLDQVQECYEKLTEISNSLYWGL